ncbi:beta-ketoacyl synthase N-terminal-like domain-containing protein [Streptomyces sp. M19]
MGLACRFADTEGPEEFWDAVARPGTPHQDRRPEQPGQVLAGGVLKDAECFDAAFFGISPGEAELMDPQQRVFLECCWHALEHAGHDPRRFPGDIGVFAGSSSGTYLPPDRRAGLAWTASPMTVEFGNGRDFLATRVSYALGLTGPSVAVQTACSTSLTAVHLASQSLADYECDLALAGGSSIALGRAAGYPYSPDGILSPDGHCRPFDSRAGGTVPSDGVAALVLRRAADALADGDHVIALLLGSAVRNDGARKVGFGAPSVDGQIAAMRAAYAAADVDPASVRLVEAHGTGTELGDPIEFAALREVLGAPRPDRRVPRQRGQGRTRAHRRRVRRRRTHRRRPGRAARGAPRSPTSSGPTRAWTWTAAGWPWRAGPALAARRGTRRAAVNSLGIGGTNVHVVLQEPRNPPAPPARTARTSCRSPRPPRGARPVGGTPARAPGARPGQHLADVAHTLQRGAPNCPAGRRSWPGRPTTPSRLWRGPPRRYRASGASAARPGWGSSSRRRRARGHGRGPLPAAPGVPAGAGHRRLRGGGRTRSGTGGLAGRRPGARAGTRLDRAAGTGAARPVPVRVRARPAAGRTRPDAGRDGRAQPRRVRRRDPVRRLHPPGRLRGRLGTRQDPGGAARGRHALGAARRGGTAALVEAGDWTWPPSTGGPVRGDRAAGRTAAAAGAVGGRRRRRAAAPAGHGGALPGHRPASRPVRRVRRRPHAPGAGVAVRLQPHRRLGGPGRGAHRALLGGPPAAHRTVPPGSGDPRRRRPAHGPAGGGARHGAHLARPPRTRPGR